MKSLVDYLGCGRYAERSSKDACDFIVNRLFEIESKIIPFFLNHPVKGIKKKKKWTFRISVKQQK